MVQQDECLRAWRLIDAADDNDAAATSTAKCLRVISESENIAFEAKDLARETSLTACRSAGGTQVN